MRCDGFSSGDGAHIVFVNAAYRDAATPLGRLMHDLTCPASDRMYHDVLAEVRNFARRQEPSGGN